MHDSAFGFVFDLTFGILRAWGWGRRYTLGRLDDDEHDLDGHLPRGLDLYMVDNSNIS